MPHPWEENWTIGERVAVGGQGITKHAYWKEDPSVHGVLKYLKNNSRFSDRARMRREVVNLQILGQFGANIPRVLEDNTSSFADSTNELYVVMAFVEGLTLQAVLDGGSPLPVERAIGFALALCKIIRLGHTQDILHRDLKPDNIIVRDAEQSDLVILDYGLSFNASQDDCITEASETLRNKYLSLPETTTPGGDCRDKRSDITAICAIVHTMLTKCIPGQLTDGNNRPPHRRKGFTLAEHNIPVHQATLLDDIFTRGLSGNLSNRFQSVDDLESSLRDVIAPAAEELSDPRKMATHLSSELRRRHRLTQLSSFVPFADQIWKHLRGICNQYRQMEEFQLGIEVFNKALAENPSIYNITIEYGAEFSRVPSNGMTLKLKAAHSQTTRSNLFLLCSVDAQCVLLSFTKTELSGPHGGPFGEHVPDRWTNPIEVGRFEDTPESILPLVTIFVRKWLTEQVSSIHNEMLGE